MCMICHTSCVCYGIMVCMISCMCIHTYGMIYIPIHHVVVYLYHQGVVHVGTPYTVYYVCTMYTSCVWYVIHHMYGGITICDIMVCVYIPYVVCMYIPIHHVVVYLYYQGVVHIGTPYTVYYVCTMYTSCVCYVIHHVYAMVSLCDIMVCVYIPYVVCMYIPMYAYVHTIHHVVVYWIPLWGPIL